MIRIIINYSFQVIITLIIIITLMQHTHSYNMKNIFNLIDVDSKFCDAFDKHRATVLLVIEFSCNITLLFPYALV